MRCITRLCVVLFGVAICFSQSAVGSEKLLSKGERNWKYFDSKDAPNEAWKSAEFDDTEWKTGRAPLGYGEKDVKTRIGFGDDSKNKHMIAYFRLKVEIEKPQQFAKILGRIRCDDGAAVYVNGKEVFRLNLPGGKITSRTVADKAIGPDGAIERIYHGFFIDPKELKAGENTLAVSVHQASPASSDMMLDIDGYGLNEKEVVEAKKLLKKQSKVPILRFPDHQ